MTDTVPTSDTQHQFVLAGVMQQLEATLSDRLDATGLPLDGLFVDAAEREAVCVALIEAAEGIDADRRAQAHYLSKFMTAATVGLFDAAMVYLWDAVIVELRRRVEAQGLSTFVDRVTFNDRQRQQLKAPNGLARLKDRDLVHGCALAGLISGDSERRLLQIENERARAASGPAGASRIGSQQLASWVQICVAEVLDGDGPPLVSDFGAWTAMVRAAGPDQAELADVVGLLRNLPQAQADDLAVVLLALHSEPDESATTKVNVARLFPLLWPRLGFRRREELRERCQCFLGELGEGARSAFVGSLLMEFLAAGPGAEENTEPLYIELIDHLREPEAELLAAAVADPAVSQRLRQSRGQDQYRRLLAMIEVKLSLGPARDLVEILRIYPGEMADAPNDPRVRELLDQLPRR